MKLDDLKARLKLLADVIQQTGSSHADNAAICTEALTAITDLEAQVQSLTAELTEERAMWANAVLATAGAGTDLEALVGELGEAGTELALRAGILNTALDGKTQYTVQRQAVLEAMQAFTATLAKLEKARG